LALFLLLWTSAKEGRIITTNTAWDFEMVYQLEQKKM